MFLLLSLILCLTVLYLRAGVYHHSKTIPALPPVPPSGRTQPARRVAAKAKAITIKTPASRKKAGEGRKSGQKTPRGGSQLIQRYKNISPRASFAPKNFQFSLQLQPQPAQPREEEKEEAAAVRSPSPSAPAVTPARRRSRRISGVQVQFLY